MSDFAEHVDRRLYLARLAYHELTALLVGLDVEAFEQLFPDYAAWRGDRVVVRLREAERAAAYLAVSLEALRKLSDVPAKPRLRHQLWRPHGNSGP